MIAAFFIDEKHRSDCSEEAISNDGHFLKTVFILRVAIVLLSLNGLWSGIDGLVSNGSIFVLGPKIFISILGLFVVWLSVAKKRTMNFLYYAWFIAQTMVFSIRTFSEKKEFFTETIFYDSSTVNLGFGLGWWLSDQVNREMLFVQFNVLFIVLAFIFERYVKIENLKPNKPLDVTP